MSLVLLALAIVSAPAQEAVQDTPPQRIRNVLVRPGEPCPQATSPNEVVVCAPADPEQFRIPKQFREEPVIGGPNTAWNVRARQALDDNRRVLPGSCSPVGTGGQSGCPQQALEAWAAERRGNQDGPAPR
jgi:hypothetical protein